MLEITDGFTYTPLLFWLISQFWQNTQLNVHPEKKIVYDGTRTVSSPICRNSDDIPGCFTPQLPVFFPTPGRDVPSPLGSGPIHPE